MQSADRARCAACQAAGSVRRSASWGQGQGQGQGQVGARTLEVVELAWRAIEARGPREAEVAALLHSGPAQLAVVVEAPAVDRALVGYGKGVVPAGDDLHDEDALREGGGKGRRVMRWIWPGRALPRSMACGGRARGLLEQHAPAGMCRLSGWCCHAQRVPHALPPSWVLGAAVLWRSARHQRG
jgi:hypothetical protein